MEEAVDSILLRSWSILWAKSICSTEILCAERVLSVNVYRASKSGGNYVDTTSKLSFFCEDEM